MTATPHTSDSKAADLAFEVLDISQQLLFVKMRFLEPAFYRLKPVADDKATLWVDGQELHFSPEWVIRRYLKDEALVARDYLHAVMHCVFSHPFIGGEVDRGLWDLACDVAVESLITSLEADAVRCEREFEQAELVDRLKEEVGTLTAERVYRWLGEQNLGPSAIQEWQRRFVADDHTPWYAAHVKRRGAEQGERDDAESSDDEALDSADDEDEDHDAHDGGREEPDDADEQADTPTDEDGFDRLRGTPSSHDPDEDDEEELLASRPAGEGTRTGSDEEPDDASQNPDEDDEAQKANDAWDAASDRDGADEQTRQDWADIANRMQVELETMGRSAGAGSSDLVEAVRALNRQTYDYEEFLRSFAVTGEVMGINPDEFDYVYYTYGLTLYRNMPLIEPLEYKDDKRISEFVIAIDTSASTKGSLVAAFINKTFNVLKQTESFFKQVKIYVVQCDAEVQDVQVLTNMDEVDDFVAGLKLHGFGGTDFRPVFEYVDQLIEQQELTDLKGLIYFTDGYGEFPAKMPGYKTAFVFVDDGRSNPDVPPWAIKLILDEKELR